MPGARVRSTPTMISIAPAMAEISMKPMPSSQKSSLMPGEYVRVGERRIHEPAAGRRESEEDAREEREAAEEVRPERVRRQPRKRQVARAPACSAAAARAIASTAGTANRNIIVVPCIVKSWLYSDRADQRVVRHRELRAHDQREDAREHEEQQRGRRRRTRRCSVLLTAVSSRSPVGVRHARLQRFAALPAGAEAEFGKRARAAQSVIAGVAR